MAAQEEFTGEYQVLADTGNGPAGEAQHFKKILCHAATAPGESQPVGSKEAGSDSACKLLAATSKSSIA